MANKEITLAEYLALTGANALAVAVPVYYATRTPQVVAVGAHVLGTANELRPIYQATVSVQAVATAAQTVNASVHGVHQLTIEQMVDMALVNQAPAPGIPQPGFQFDLRSSNPFGQGPCPATAVGRGVWDLHPFQRGRVIEQQLGHNLPSNFPTIDRFQNGVATSIKSMDLAAPSYADPATITSTGRGYIDSVAAFQGRDWAGVQIGTRYGGPAITARGLDLAVPSGAMVAQRQALNNLVTYGAQQGVTVRIVVVP